MVPRCTYVALLRSKRPLSWMWNIKSPPFRYSITKKRCSCEKQHIIVSSLSQTNERRRVWETEWILIRGAGTVGLYQQLGIVALTAAARADSLAGNMLLYILLKELFSVCVCVYFRLERGVEVCEEGVLPGEGQDSLLDHGALHIIIHENHILLQNLHSKVLPLSLQLRQQHLRCQNHLEWVLHQSKRKSKWGGYSYLYIC